jgi:hypothetical protein
MRKPVCPGPFFRVPEERAAWRSFGTHRLDRSARPAAPLLAAARLGKCRDRLLSRPQRDCRRHRRMASRLVGERRDGCVCRRRTSGGPDRLLGARRSPRSCGTGTVRNQNVRIFCCPLRARFGTWQLASWDRQEIHSSYHMPTPLCWRSAWPVSLRSSVAPVFTQQRRAAAVAHGAFSFVNRVSHELRTPLTNILP